MHHTPLVAAALVGLTFASPAAAQPAPPLAFKAGVDVVPVTVTIQHTDGSYATGLPSTSFRVFDEGKEQPIVLFAAGGVPVDVLLLLDTSASINARLPTMQAAATRLVRSLRPDDRAMLLTFGTSTRILQPLTSDPERIITAMRTITCDGSTSMYDAIYVALHQFGMPAAVESLRRRALVVFSDGDDTASLTSFESVLEAARRGAVATYTIRLMSPFDKIDAFGRSAFELRELARDTGGRAFTSRGTDELSNAYEAVSGDLAHQYVLGFVQPSGTVSGVHRIGVVVNTGHIPLLHRAAYVAERPATGR